MPNESKLGITIEAYETHLTEYLEGTPNLVSGEYKLFLDKILKYVEITSKILEIGSGPGKDADYIETLGYSVTRSDVAESFIKYQKGRNKNIHKLDVVSDKITGTYDLVFAIQVFLHFNEAELKTALHNVYDSLNSNGILALTLKSGEGDQISTHKLGVERYFKFWQTKTIQPILKQTGFEIIENIPDSNNQLLRLICGKIS